MKVTYQIFYLHQGFLLMLPPVPWLPSRDLYAKLNFDGSYIPLIEKDELEASSTIHPGFLLTAFTVQTTLHSIKVELQAFITSV